jgi:hypothetical protein
MTSRSSRPWCVSAPGGYDEALGFTVYETLRHHEALEPLMREEVRVMLERFPARSAPTAPPR